MKEIKDLIALVERHKTTSEKLIVLSWEDSDWHEVLQMIGKQVAQLEAENERLREAMEKIAGYGIKLDRITDGSSLFRQYARDALKEGE